MSKEEYRTSPAKKRLFGLRKPAETAADIEQCKQAFLAMPELSELFPPLLIGEEHSHDRFAKLFDEIAAAPMASAAQAVLCLVMALQLPERTQALDREAPGYTDSKEWALFSGRMHERMHAFAEGRDGCTDIDMILALATDFALIEETLAFAAHV